MNSGALETSIFQSGVSRKTQSEGEREEHEGRSAGGGPLPFRGVPVTDGGSGAMCVCPLAHHCVYHLCHLSSNQEFKSMTLSKTIIATP